MTTNVPKTLYDVRIVIAGEIVGRAEGLTLTRTQSLQHKFQAGSRIPYAIQRLGVEPTGTLVRAWLDNTLIKTLVDYKTGNNPDFDLYATDKIDGEEWAITGAVLGTTSLNLTSDSGEENYEFSALRIEPSDAGL